MNGTVLAHHVSQPGDMVVRLYLNSLDSPASRSSMAASLKAVASLIAEHADRSDLPPGSVDPSRVDWAALDFQSATAVRALMAGRWSAATINRHLAAVRGVVKTARLTGLTSATQADAVKEALRPAKRQFDETDPTARLVTDRELREVFAAMATSPAVSARRDAAILAVLAMGAVRRSELVWLDLSDWHPEAGELIVRRGKGGKRRKVFLHGGAVEALNDWLALRGTDDGPLLTCVSKSGIVTGDRLTTHAVWRRLRLWADRAGVPRFAPHDMRRKAATDLLDDGADINAVRSLLGHSNIATTALYDRRGERAARSASARLSVPYTRPRT